MQTINFKKLGIAALLLAISMSLLFSNRTQAQNSTSPFTGTCGGVFNIGSIYDALWEYRGNSIDYGEGVSVLISMNFNTLKADLSAQTVTILDSNNQPLNNGGFGHDRAPRNGEQKIRDIQKFTDRSFTIAPLDGVNGAYLVTLSLPQDDETFVMMPVNGGNTFLIQGKSFGAAGVCQKV
jgi:hypothetical protein